MFTKKNRNIRTLRILPKDLNLGQKVEEKIWGFINSGFKFKKIIKIKQISKSVHVFDLTIKQNQNFFVNKKLVHNCPMPLNCDLYDALQCPYRCQYCFADAFRASLYTSFFDNSKNLGLRSCNPSFFRPELDKLMKYRGKRNEGNELQRAIGLQIPIRLGIRFEDFLPIEGKKKICLDFLSYLRDEAYPVMINTKSSLIGREDYIKVLVDNQGGSAVHVTAISADDEVNKILEPGAPLFMERIQAIRSLTQAGIRVVARIEPFMIFLNDEKNKVDEWIKAMIDAGVQHITLDTYSWSASAPGIRRQMEMLGIDFDRIFLLMSDSQWLGSLLLSKFIEYLQPDFYCSTFDFGNVPSNDQDICCEVGDLFLSKGAGFSYGNNLMAIRFIQSHKGKPVIWGMYDEWVESKGGWLSESLRQDVFKSWNLIGNPAYFPDWAVGIECCGTDFGGFKVWKYQDKTDFRMELLQNMLNLG
jgi:DNA repair photolyase